MDVWVMGRTAARLEAVAAEIGGHALASDVAQENDVTSGFEQADPVDRSSTTRACKARR
jgi:NADP-dependent 3-hydroxy acid dehydrogenase YdfG